MLWFAEFLFQVAHSSSARFGAAAKKVQEASGLETPRRRSPFYVFPFSPASQPNRKQYLQTPLTGAGKGWTGTLTMTFEY